MAVSLPPWVFQQYRDDDGVPLAGGTVSFFVAGEDTPLAAYTDATQATAIENSVLTLDSSGYGIFWLQVGLAYKIVLANADETWSRTVDSVLVPSGGLAYEHSFYVPDVWDDTTPLLVHNYPRDVTFAANWAGSYGSVETPPATSKVITLTDADDVTIGTVTVSTAGAVTFATTNPAGKTFAAAERMKAVPPEAGLGATTGLAITFAGTVA
jgi:hypothetical protein